QFAFSLPCLHVNKLPRSITTTIFGATTETKPEKSKTSQQDTTARARRGIAGPATQERAFAVQ
ncbi:hypothetical protein DVA81_19155, partial [Acinetobacter baumannii]